MLQNKMYCFIYRSYWKIQVFVTNDDIFEASQNGDYLELLFFFGVRTLGNILSRAFFMLRFLHKIFHTVSLNVYDFSQLLIWWSCWTVWLICPTFYLVLKLDGHSGCSSSSTFWCPSLNLLCYSITHAWDMQTSP